MAYRLTERPLRVTTLAGYEQELRERARQENAKTVEVLERAKGLSEDGAVTLTIDRPKLSSADEKKLMEERKNLAVSE